MSLINHNIPIMRSRGGGESRRKSVDRNEGYNSDALSGIVSPRASPHWPRKPSPQRPSRVSLSPRLTTLERADRPEVPYSRTQTQVKKWLIKLYAPLRAPDVSRPSFQLPLGAPCCIYNELGHPLRGAVSAWNMDVTENMGRGQRPPMKSKVMSMFFCYFYRFC